MDRLTNLGIFVIVMEEGSLATVTYRFELSTVMTSKHVSTVKADLNAWLLYRTTRRLNLTNTGQTYYECCKRTFKASDEAKREASDFQGAARGMLHTMASVTFDAMHLDEVVARYMENHPNATVEAQLDNRYVDFIDAGVDVTIWIRRLGVSGLAACRLAPC